MLIRGQMMVGNSDKNRHFGSLVRAYRREMGLTQRELAAKAGLSLAALRDFEQSRRVRPRADSLTALTDALGLDADQAASLARAAALPRRRPDEVPSAHRPLGGSDCARRAHPPGHDTGLWLSVLGPLEAWTDGKPLRFGSPARRAVLGLLLLDPGVPVHRDAIVDLLWGDAPPRTAVSLVQAHVSRIRRALKGSRRVGGDDEVIDSFGGAYRLSLSAMEVDLLDFRDLAARAAAAREDGEDATAVEYYERAMSLWRGEPFADVAALRGHPGITALRQELVGVLLQYAELTRELGQHNRALVRLQALADAEPLNERVHAYLMIALAGSGQQADAIRVYEGVRSRLDRELGLYPGEELADAYMRVLRQDLRAPDREPTHARMPPIAAAAGHPVPRQLPAAPRCFTGRAGELAWLSALAEQDMTHAKGVVIAALTGTAGIGKTALAVHWAHQMAPRFPGGQLFVNLRGSGPSGTPVAPADAVAGVLLSLGVPPGRIPPDIDGRAALYRSLLADCRMLIVLDDAHDAEQVRPLLPGSPTCLVLITSRSWLTGLAAEGAHLMTLGALPENESRKLLALHLRARSTTADPAVINELAASCGGLPLAVCDAATRAVVSPGLPLATLASELPDTRRRLDAPDAREPVSGLRAVFSWSRARLGSLASRLFRLLGIYPGPDITVPVAASLAALTPGQTRLALGELCAEHLLTEHLPGRYTCHELLRSYAAEEAGLRENQEDRRAAVQRVLDHYLRASVLASSFLGHGQAEVDSVPPRPGITLEEIEGLEQAADWFENEQHVLLAVIRQAAEGGYAPYAWELPWTAGWFFRGQACWRRLASAQEAALAVAIGQDDLVGQAMARQQLGWLSFLLGDVVSASHHLDKADEVTQQFGNGRFQAPSGLSRAHVPPLQHRILVTTAQARQVVRLSRDAADLQDEIRALHTIDSCLVRLGGRRQAVHLSSRAPTAYRELGLRCCPYSQAS
ncbi:BTAD domain-containing putative transcriptional regulator [Streptomyces sp. NPDC006335]|uniref:BTAD domain-containing putative transcriptional regulator n=1 Tax=Streptomyces sp. NPDC006335 TaxID=3156895 RepID=UPI0033BDD4F6